MVTRSKQYLVDEAGKKTAVVLGIREYVRLLRRAEDRGDARELARAVKTETEFRDYREIRKELRRKGRL
jgi:hypothetical protein